MGPSFPRMGLRFCLLYFAFLYYVRVGSVKRYNTYPQPVPTPYRYQAPHVIAKMCYLKPDPGPCRANIGMYYYNPDEKNCTQFYWGGCQGNGNRFNRFSECLQTCLSSPDMRRSAPRYCQLSFDYGFCFGAQKRWYYDRTWKVCKNTLYSGCGGNKNNFYTYEKCDSICRLGHEDPSQIKTTRSGHKKYLIINPPNATSARGLEQGGRKGKKTTAETEKTQHFTRIVEVKPKKG